MNPGSAALGPLGRVARAAFWTGFVYWAFFSLVAPVTTIDSQMYNLARLELAARGGLFNSDYFTSVFHITFPWAFDAVHFPFMLLGWGCVIPGFLCLTGALFVVFTLMRERFGPDAAWAGAASLLALPCLVYQGASTKNDIAVLFCLAVWVYARWRWKREGAKIHLGWMVAAIAFMAGSKTTGVIYGVILSLVTLWDIRADRGLILKVSAGLLAGGIMFGSVETYVEAARVYGHPMGPPALLRRYSNQNGVRGGLASLIRHLGGGIYVGPTDFRDRQPAAWAVSGAAEKLLDRLGISDAGIEPRFRGKPLFFSQNGHEELSGFGPLGLFAELTMLGAILYWRPRARWWQLAMISLGGVGLMSMTVAYSPWMNRYLISCYTVGTLGFVCALWEIEARWSAGARWAAVTVIAAALVAAPLLSFNRGPGAIVDAFRDRERLETSDYPVVGALRERLRAWRTQVPAARIYVVVNDESPVLPILEDKKIAATLVTRATLQRLAGEGRLRPGDLVTTEGGTPPPYLSEVETVSAPNVYSDQGTLTQYIYRVNGQPGAAGQKL